MKICDIIYINGAYVSLYLGELILYEGILINKGKIGLIKKIGEFYFIYDERENISTKEEWKKY